VGKLHTYRESVKEGKQKENISYFIGLISPMVFCVSVCYLLLKKCRNPNFYLYL